MELSARDQITERLVAEAQRNPEFRQRLLADPNGTISEVLGASLPESVSIRVVEATPTHQYLVLPMVDPANELSDMELEEVAGGGVCWDTRPMCWGTD